MKRGSASDSSDSKFGYRIQNKSGQPRVQEMLVYKSREISASSFFSAISRWAPS